MHVIDYKSHLLVIVLMSGGYENICTCSSKYKHYLYRYAGA
jgi:hypothetical protein